MALFSSIIFASIVTTTYLFCLGICPQSIVFDMWKKGDVAENKAGRLVRMAEGQAVTYKLTKTVGRDEGISIR